MAKILLCDDDSDSIDAMKILLTAKGHQITSTTKGETAYTLARTEKFDLLLLDVMMAYDSEGMEIARRIHDNPATKGIPVILVTGIHAAKNMQFRLEPDSEWLPVRAILEKPVKPEELLGAVELVLGG